MFKAVSILCFLCFVGLAYAAPHPAAIEAHEASAPDDTFESVDEHDEVEDYTSIEFLDWTQDKASSYVEGLNDSVDSFFMGAFFDDEVLEDESSGSNGRLFFTSRREDGTSPDYRIGLNLRLVLPKTRDRFKLLLETDENEDDINESNLLNTKDNVTYSTAIRVEVDRGKHWKTSFDNGVKWSGEPVYFSRVRARRQDYFNEWKTRVLQTISWRTDEEWGANFDAYALHPMDLRHYFRLDLNADYLLSDDFANLETSFSVFKEINYRSAMVLKLAFFGNTEEYTKVSNTVLSLSYRRKIFADYFYVELVPEVGWPREYHYEATPAFTLVFEMIFGADN